MGLRRPTNHTPREHCNACALNPKDIFDATYALCSRVATVLEIAVSQLTIAMFFEYHGLADLAVYARMLSDAAREVQLVLFEKAVSLFYQFKSIIFYDLNTTAKGTYNKIHHNTLEEFDNKLA